MVEQKLSRFLIPFYFESAQYHDYSRRLAACTEQTKKQTDTPLWQPWHISNREHQFLSTVLDSLDGTRPNHLGVIWELTSDNDRRMKSRILLEMPDGKTVVCRFQKDGMGVALFKTGVGFAWFEVVPQGPPALWKEDPRISWQEEPLDPHQIIELNCYFRDICHRGGAGARHGVYENQAKMPDEPTSTLFQWLDDFFFQALPGIHFFSGIQTRTRDGACTVGPDKAHVFAALRLAQQPEPAEADRLLYWLKKGYRPSYRPPDKLSDTEIQPFENVRWDASLEGCASLIWRTGRPDTDVVFCGTAEGELGMWGKTVEAGFLLYLLALMQHYTLLRLSGELTALPDGLEAYTPKEYRRLQALREELALAYVRAFFPQVSAVEHHNAIYALAQEGLQNRLLREALSAQTQQLDELAQACAQRKRARNASYITVVSGIFVVLQTLNNVLGIYDMEPRLAVLGRWGFALMVFAAAVALGSALTALAQRWLRKKERG